MVLTARVLKIWAPLAAVLFVLNLLDGPYPGSHWLSNQFYLHQDRPVLAVLFVLGLAALLVNGRIGRAAVSRGGWVGAKIPRSGSTLSSPPGGSTGEAGVGGLSAPQNAAANAPFVGFADISPKGGKDHRARRHALINLKPLPAVAALAVACALIAWAGTFLVFDNYALSMDEFMANFDAAILARGQLMARFAPDWRPLLGALGPQFLFHPGNGAYWMSQYLPVNAALRALGALAGAQSLVSPALAAISVLAVFGVGRRAWPEEPRIAALAAVMLATSSQFLITAMTPYAMTAHLAFNLVWLWLFLGGRPLGHAGALAVGFFACGLHQLAFHPLFVAPFIAQLWLDRRWALGALYTLAYGAICAFWLAYPVLAAGLVGAHGLGPAGGAGWFAAHAGVDLEGVGVMAKNLIRFATWQNLMVAPLFVLGAVAAVRAKGVARALVLGFILTNLAAYGIRAYQGHGWGYRYVHGLLGSVCLIAAWTWSRAMRDLDAAKRAAGARVMAAVAAVSVLVLLPVRAWQAHAFAHPYAMAEALIRAAPTDGVIVDDAGTRFTIDLARNDPYLTNRPLVFYRGFVDEAAVRALCAHHSLSVIDQSDLARLGIHTFPVPPERRPPDLKPLLRTLQCDMTAAK